MMNFDPKYPLEKIKLTKSVLSCISTHLAKKKSCRKQIYRVAIGIYDDKQEICRKLFYNEKIKCYDCIFFDSNARLVSHSCMGWRRYSPVIQHIMIEHFDNVWAGAANGNQAQIKSEMLIPGIYEYRLSASGKYRKWFKVE